MNCNVAVNEFFPFGTQHGDIELNPANKDDGSSNTISLIIAFPFFNYLHNSIWVNVNGAISFLKPISTYTPICTAMTQEFRMIAPFWADVDLSRG